MFSIQLIKVFQIFLFIGFLLLTGIPASATSEKMEVLDPEKVNLALRRTADGLLRLSGDLNSRIPAVEQAGNSIWRIRLEQSFRYEQLPMLLQSSLDVYDIDQAYQVAVKRCEDAVIDLGYHQFDFIKNKTVPCAGRELPETCHYIEITFLQNANKSQTLLAKTGFLFLILTSIFGFWFFYKSKLVKTTEQIASDSDLLSLGNSRLDVSGQQFIYGSLRQSLTFRETKLLRLFASSPDQLLEREFILNQVWADEGVLVGRSIDVFVSRLRKKIAADPSIGIVAIHGVGYRLETGKA
ncbi:MAG TPA: winged helix-turn-helix domain-containing protein [Saprospiraceae bacterium]|nr:winged helix-turn-helix domain-containing protein [Saprospiraceae bacterium]